MNDIQGTFTDETEVAYSVEFQGRHLYALTQVAVAQELFKSVHGIEALCNKIVLKDLPHYSIERSIK